MAHRKWKEAKQLPGRAGPGNMLGCSLISFHFLLAIHPIRPVRTTQQPHLLSDFLTKHNARLPCKEYKVQCCQFDIFTVCTMIVASNMLSYAARQLTMWCVILSWMIAAAYITHFYWTAETNTQYTCWNGLFFNEGSIAAHNYTGWLNRILLF